MFTIAHYGDPLVFQKSRGPVDLTDYRNWWVWAPGTSWQHPRGPQSSIDDIAQHPVAEAIRIVCRITSRKPAGTSKVVSGPVSCFLIGVYPALPIWKKRESGYMPNGAYLSVVTVFP